MPIKRRQKTIGKALAVAVATTLACVYVWMKTRDTGEGPRGDERDYGEVCVVVTQEVMENEFMMPMISEAMARNRKLVLVVHPAVDADAIDVAEQHRVLRVSQESSIYHILKQIRPDVTLVPENLHQSALVEHRLDRFLLSVVELNKEALERYVVGF